VAVQILLSPPRRLSREKEWEGGREEGRKRMRERERKRENGREGEEECDRKKRRWMER
jgi:hypothetical protein